MKSAVWHNPDLLTTIAAFLPLSDVIGLRGTCRRMHHRVYTHGRSICVRSPYGSSLLWALAPLRLLSVRGDSSIEQLASATRAGGVVRLTDTLLIHGLCRSRDLQVSGEGVTPGQTPQGVPP